jgi:hypothetical protein
LQGFLRICLPKSTRDHKELRRSFLIKNQEVWVSNWKWPQRCCYKLNGEESKGLPRSGVEVRVMMWSKQKPITLLHPSAIILYVALVKCNNSLRLRLRFWLIQCRNFGKVCHYLKAEMECQEVVDTGQAKQGCLEAGSFFLTMNHPIINSFCLSEFVYENIFLFKIMVEIVLVC